MDDVHNAVDDSDSSSIPDRPGRESSRYGPRDCVSVLMARGHRVTLRWKGRDSWYLLDGQRASWRELEDRAERYERLRYRITERN